MTTQRWASLNAVQDLNSIFDGVEIWEGNLVLDFLRDVSVLKLPKRMKGGVLKISPITSADGLAIPQGVKVLYLLSLTDARGLVIPDSLRLSKVDLPRTPDFEAWRQRVEADRRVRGIPE